MPHDPTNHDEREIILRVPRKVKRRAVSASRRRNMKLTPWCIQALSEQATREGIPDKCEDEPS